MTLEFESMTAGGRFSDPCDMGIMDLRRLCNDEVVSRFPRFLGRWEDGQTLELLLSTGFSYATSDDDCVPSTISSESTSCVINLPDQELVSIGGGQNKQMRDLITRFCKARNLQSAPTLFNSDGSLNRGEPLAGYFIEFMISELKMGFMQRLIWLFWNGDGTTRHQFSGFGTQLDTDITACSSYNPTVLDWATLTGVVGVSSPKSEIDAAHDSITIAGEVFSGLEGTDFAEFLKLWVQRLMEGPFSGYAPSEVELVLMVPRNSAVDVAELAACLQPCDGCTNPLSDPNIRERASEFINGKRFWLYPYQDVVINMWTSPNLDNRMILMPMSVAGKPMAGWVFRSQPEQQAIIEGRLPIYGTGTGAIPATTLFPNVTDMTSQDNWEAQAIAINVEKAGDCLNWWLTADAGILIFGRDNILVVDNINGLGLVQTCTTTGTFTDLALATCTDGPNANELTISDLDDAGVVDANTEYVSGTGYLITFDDGTVLLATLTVGDATTVVLTFPSTVTVTDCTTFDGPVAISSLP